MNNKRAMYMLAVFCFLFLTLIGYMTYTEIKYSETYNKTTYNPRIIAKNKIVTRGSIYDRNGVELAYTERIEGEFKRRYPYENLYSHVIGYVSKDFSTQTQLEARYNSELLGYSSNGLFTNIINTTNKDYTRGNDLYLTIDHELQQTAHDAMGTQNGAIVLLDVKTGEVLAMVSKPDFNPADENFFEKLNEGDLIARAYGRTYPPGSTYKTVTTASIIDNGYEDEVYDDTTGEYVIKSADGNPDNDYHCRNGLKQSAYGETDLEKAFVKSSNVYFAHLSTILDTKMIQETANDFYFNQSIPFDLPVKTSTFAKGSMTDAEKIMASIGQGQTEATPLHMALIAASVANDGIMPRPYLVSEIKSGSESVDDFKYDDLGRVISESTANQIKDYMRTVVVSGTGTNAAISNIKVCGKTGTSENEVSATKGNSHKTHSVFIGFAPYDEPEVAICVLMEYVGFGSEYATPAARIVLEKYFELY